MATRFIGGNYPVPKPNPHASGSVSGRGFGRIGEGMREYGLGFSSGGTTAPTAADATTLPWAPTSLQGIAAAGGFGGTGVTPQQVAAQQAQANQTIPGLRPTMPLIGPSSSPLSLGYANSGAPSTGLGAGGYATGGLVASATPGRMDKVTTAVHRGSYIIPADVVSAQGQGNTMAGEAAYKKMVAAAPKQHGSSGYATGGMVDVHLSGGEFVVPPHVVAHAGRGDAHRGARRLDKHVAAVRARAVHTMSRLPPPHQ